MCYPALNMFFHQKKEDSKTPLPITLFGNVVGSLVLAALEAVKIFVIAAAIIIPVRYFLIQPFIVKGASMESSYYDGEYLVIDELTPRFRDYERGDVVVFRPPNDAGEHYIKRVIGLPGETVELKDGIITIFNEEYPNGIQLEEEYIDDYTSGHQRIDLSFDEYYLLGDNRDHSLDSRKFGTVKESSIIGKVWFRGLPFDRIGVIGSPEYNF